MFSFFSACFHPGVKVEEGLDTPIPTSLRQSGRGAISHRSLRCRKSFSLLELVVVFGVIAILGGMVFGVGRHAVTKGKTVRARAELAVLSAALDSYRLAQGDYPRTNLPAHLLQSLIGRRGPDYQPWDGPPLIESARFSTAGSIDPFLNETAELLDPWDHPYLYCYRSQAPWTNPTFVLWSAGPDGTDTATLLLGGFPDLLAPGNADNVNANQP